MSQTHSAALFTDHYELTMLKAFINEGIQDKRATFEVFTRKLPQGRRYGVFAGLGRLLPMIRDFRFEGGELLWLLDSGIIDKPTADYLSTFTFTGTIESYREGEIFFPQSPVLTVSGTLGESILLETLILSVLNHDSAIATTAARMIASAGDRPIIEMGSRRTNEESAVAAARAAYIAGFSATSNLAAGYVYGVPTTGTAAHAFTLAHSTETEAFESQIAALGVDTTLLVDTYDIEEGIRHAVFAAQDADQSHVGVGPGAIRIDSGDLAYEAGRAREILDSLGALGTNIVVTSDLDEYVIKDLATAPIDAYGVGTKLVSSDPVGFVYKLVAIEDGETMRSVAKKAKDKVSVGGKKYAWRETDQDGKIVSEVFTTSESMPRAHTGAGRYFRGLQVFAMADGKVQEESSLQGIREYHAAQMKTLPEGERKVWHGEFGPFLTAERVVAL